ncbi:MAG: MaoC-like dehydratase [Candidatus Binatia bacterium]|nr:MAG: MaoC-like dehydratase [Candidatus Binatia bacterium]
MKEKPPLRYPDVKVGDEIPPFVVEKLTRADFVRYAGASGDFNPIHYDQTFAEAAGLPTVFAQGMLNAGFLAKCVTDYVGVGNLRKFRVRFATRVWPGDTVTCRGRVTEKYVENGRCYIAGELESVTQKGEVALRGSFVAELPPD